MIRSLLPGTSFAPLPYGVVMASGGAGKVAGLIGLHHLTWILTAVAIIQAVLIPIGNMAAQGGIAVPRWRFGLFTIPLGLAVIAGNMQSLAPVSGDIALALAWLATLALACGPFLPAAPSGWKAGRVDGSWFLAPAALLGDATATAVAAGPSPAGWLWLAVAACLAGVAGYVLVIVASGIRLYRHGMSGSPLSPWWISAGCGGLAAASLGTVARLHPGSSLRLLLESLVIFSWMAGTILLIAVLAGCAWYALQRDRGPWSHIWTPVFSTAVYAAGTDSLARLGHIAWLQEFTLVTVLATLLLWIANSLLYLLASGRIKQKTH